MNTSYSKKMNSFSVAYNEPSRRNRESLESRSSSMNSANEFSNIANEGENDAEVDDDDNENNKFRVSFDSRNYINSTLLKAVDSPNNLFRGDKLAVGGFCQKCRLMRQIERDDLTTNLNTSLSLPSLTDLPDSFKINTSTL